MKSVEIYTPLYLSYYLVGIAMMILPDWDFTKLTLVIITAVFIALVLKNFLEAIPSIFYMVHLFLVSFTEEIVFRYFIQDVFFNKHLMLYPPYYNIIVTSVLFSLVHINLKNIDVSYHILVFIAGLIYGSIYNVLGLEMAIFVHFLINIIFKCAFEDKK